MDSILDRAPCGFVSFGDDGTIRAVNQTLLDWLHRPRSEVEGAHVESLLSTGAQLFYHTHLFPLLKIQGHAEEIYLSLRTAEDEERPCLLRAKRREQDGTPVNEGVLLPFEQRNQYENEILRAKQTAEQANRAKDRFLSTVSHELRTPISTIKSLSQYLAMGVRGPVTDEQTDYLTRIERAADYLETLIGDMLDFARLEAGSASVMPEPVSVAEALDRTEALIEVRFEEAALTYEAASCPPDLCVRADPDRLQQILLNLFTNAAKFTPPGGTVGVSVEAGEKVVHIRVRDTGPGISEADQDQIFAPFVQAEAAERSSDGIGLGLAISRDLAEAMDGTLTLDSTVGKGSTFTVTLPRVAPPSPSD